MDPEITPESTAKPEIPADKPAAAPNVLVLRHIAFEDLGTWEPALRDAGWQVRYLDVGVDVFRLDGSEDGEEREALRSAGLVVVLGAPVCATDVEHYPYLAEEVALIRERLQRDCPVLGVCLGAQLIALALGGGVRAGGGPMNIGWWPVDLTAQAERHAIGQLAGHPVLHWHGDRIEVPAGIVPLASTEGVPVQAFAAGAGLGVQCHPEMDWRALERWLIGHQGDLAQHGVDLDALREHTARFGPTLAGRSRAMLLQWLETVT